MVELYLKIKGQCRLKFIDFAGKSEKCFKDMKQKRNNEKMKNVAIHSFHNAKIVVMVNIIPFDV